MSFSTNNTTNMSSNLYCSGYNNQQVAYPVGLNKDSYSILTFFNQDLKTGDITVSCEVVENWIGKNKTMLYAGSYLDCVEFTRKLVTEIENQYGVWNRDERGNYVLTNPNSIV